jgi:hypothetical protein
MATGMSKNSVTLITNSVVICRISIAAIFCGKLSEMVNDWRHGAMLQRSALIALYIIRMGCKKTYCNIFGVSPDTRQQLSLNNENKTFPRRVTMEADVTMDLLSVTRM